MGDVGKLTAPDVAEAIQALPCWDDAGRKALAEIEEMRGFRNLAAHFAIRRFPSDDAFLFVAKSARDFKRQFGTRAVSERTESVGGFSNRLVSDWSFPPREGGGGNGAF